MSHCEPMCLFRSILLLCLNTFAVVHAIPLDINDPSSIKAAADTIAHGMMQYYTGNVSGNTPGLLPGPYYWWEGGAMFGSLIDYWYYTGDPTYNDVTTQGLQFQVGEYDNYEPQNQTFDLGNDDQAFWGMAALEAAETKFPNPPDYDPQWLPLAQAVFNRQAQRWDNATCGGGLRWQFNPFNAGYEYKNAISNGCFFNIAARLAKYTGNTTYIDWAETTWDWMRYIGLIDDNFYVYDGTDVKINCSNVNHLQWTYNAGALLFGAASLWNITGADIWRYRTQALLNGTHVFFTDEGIMMEVACENIGTCNTDQLSFKAYLSRWMAATTSVAPWTFDQIMARLRPSAIAAAAACSGPNGECGLRWTLNGTWDGTTGIGQQMAAMEAIQSQLIQQVSGPVQGNTGGISVSNPGAGLGGGASIAPLYGDIYAPTQGSKIGAGFLTAFLAITTVGGGLWMAL